MLTHQIIQGEIDELKLVLTEKDLTIPSFWNCIWPGLTFMFWFLLSSYFSYGISDFSTGLDRISSMVFAAVVGIFSIIGFLAKKCRAYGAVIFTIFPCLAFFSAYNGINAVVFIVVTGFSLLLTLMVMNIDLSRYQLATLTSVIESVRNHER